MPSHRIQVLPIRQVAIHTQNVRPHGAKKVSRTVRPNGLRIEFADLGRRTANFFSGVWREIKELFLPVHALGSEQLQCVKFLREAGIGENTNRLALGREMARAFNREYSRGSAYGVLGYKETRREASRTAARAVVKLVVKKENAAGRRVPREMRDLLRQNLESLKELQPPIQSNRLGTAGNWAGRT